MHPFAYLSCLWYVSGVLLLLCCCWSDADTFCTLPSLCCCCTLFCTTVLRMCCRTLLRLFVCVCASVWKAFALKSAFSQFASDIKIAHTYKHSVSDELKRKKKKKKSRKHWMHSAALSNLGLSAFWLKQKRQKERERERKRERSTACVCERSKANTTTTKTRDKDRASEGDRYPSKVH